MVEHVNIQSADCHEPKHISVGTTADAGKVITSSSSSDGVSTYRFLEGEEISSGSASNNFVLSPTGSGSSEWRSPTISAFGHVENATLNITAGTPVKVPFTSYDISTKRDGTAWGAVTSNGFVFPETGTYIVHYELSVKIGANEDLLFRCDTDTPVLSATTDVRISCETGGVDRHFTVSGRQAIVGTAGETVSLFVDSNAGNYNGSINRASMTAFFVE